MAVRPLSAALKKKAEIELNETPERIKTDVQILRNWMSQQPHLQAIKPSDQWLVAFLRGCKYDIEKAQGKIEMHYTFKSTVPEFYANRDPLDPGIQELLKAGILLPLKKSVSDDSPKILLARIGKFSEAERPLTDFIKVGFMISEILLLEDDNLTIAGQDILVDCKDMAFSLVWHWTPSVAKKIILCSEKALSVRLKGMHFLNAPFFVGPAVKIAKMFMGAKIKDRIHSHTKDCNTLFDHIQKSVLPEEYGGTDGTLQELTDYWRAKVESYRDLFLENSCSDESKRPKKKSGRVSNATEPLQSLEID